MPESTRTPPQIVVLTYCSDILRHQYRRPPKWLSGLFYRATGAHHFACSIFGTLSCFCPHELNTSIGISTDGVYTSYLATAPLAESFARRL